MDDAAAAEADQAQWLDLSKAALQCHLKAPDQLRTRLTYGGVKLTSESWPIKMCTASILCGDVKRSRKGFSNQV